jgi:hypothetical protein
VRTLPDPNPLYFFLGGDSLSNVPYFRGDDSFTFLKFDLSRDGIDDFWLRVGSARYLCLGGNPLDFEPDYPLGRVGANPSIFHGFGRPGMLLVDDTRVLNSYRFILYNLGIPPDTFPASYVYYGFPRFQTDPNIGDIDADDNDELALVTRDQPDSLRHIYIYNIATTGIEDDGSNDLPNAISLTAYPNPFNSSTSLHINGISQAEIDIFDITGRMIATLETEDGKAIWDASGFSSGVYFARVRDGKKAQSIKMVLLK